MSMTAEDVFSITMDLIDRRLETGLLSESDVKRYRVKTMGLLNLLQTELIEQGDLYSTYEITNKPFTNLLSDGFNITEFTEDELTYETTKSAKSYYFEVDAPCTVYVEDYDGSWNTLETITNTTATSFTAYKGALTPTANATKARLRFTGTYYFRTINRALFAENFQSDRVPDYRPWIKKQMPDNFKSLDMIVKEFPERQYEKDSAYKWEGRRDLFINYLYEGNIRIVYRPVPTAITLITDTLQVDDVTARTILPYGLAAHLLLTENQDSASFFQQRYEELKKSTKSTKTAFSKIIDYYGGFSG